MALVDLLLKLEDLTQMRIPPGKGQHKDMDTVALMFATTPADLPRRGVCRGPRAEAPHYPYGRIH
jgi:hypothetical protein